MWKIIQRKFLKLCNSFYRPCYLMSKMNMTLFCFLDIILHLEWVSAHVNIWIWRHFTVDTDHLFFNLILTCFLWKKIKIAWSLPDTFSCTHCMRHPHFLMSTWKKCHVYSLMKKPKESPFSASSFLITFLLKQMSKVVLWVFNPYLYIRLLTFLLNFLWWLKPLFPCI